MFRKFLLGSFVYLSLPAAAVANPPSVAVDIAPVHSLVAQVMAGVGEPDLIIQPGASPHAYSLRPSQARSLSSADAVFWVGEELTPWMEAPLENLSASAKKVTLLEVDGITLHGFREGVTFEAHDHHDDEHHDEHADHDEHENHDDHAGHDGEEHHDGHAKHDDDVHHEHGHDDHHGVHDPHAWLDPENAKTWLRVIAGTLSELDTANAAIYERNAGNAIARLDEMIVSIRGETKSLHDIRFIVFHDAYQYFERRFEVQATGAISIGDASDPSPARVKQIRDTVTDLGIRCVFTEPQYNPEMVRSVFEDTQVVTIGVMDPLGADIAPGTDHYANLLGAMTASLKQCQD